jgi:hypothetical protein
MKVGRANSGFSQSREEVLQQAQVNAAKAKKLQELKGLLDEGKITTESYEELVAAQQGRSGKPDLEVRSLEKARKVYAHKYLRDELLNGHGHGAKARGRGHNKKVLKEQYLQGAQHGLEGPDGEEKGAGIAHMLLAKHTSHAFGASSLDVRAAAIPDGDPGISAPVMLPPRPSANAASDDASVAAAAAAQREKRAREQSEEGRAVSVLCALLKRLFARHYKATAMAAAMASTGSKLDNLTVANSSFQSTAWLCTRVLASLCRQHNKYDSADVLDSIAQSDSAAGDTHSALLGITVLLNRADASAILGFVRETLSPPPTLSVREAGEDMVPVDTTGDGVADMVGQLVDTTGDGVMDSIGVDTVKDGKIDRTLSLGEGVGPASMANMTRARMASVGTRMQRMNPRKGLARLLGLADDDSATGTTEGGGAVGPEESEDEDDATEEAREAREREVQWEKEQSRLHELRDLVGAGKLKRAVYETLVVEEPARITSESLSWVGSALWCLYALAPSAVGAKLVVEERAVPMAIDAVRRLSFAKSNQDGNGSATSTHSTGHSLLRLHRDAIHAGPVEWAAADALTTNTDSSYESAAAAASAAEVRFRREVEAVEKSSSMLLHPGLLLGGQGADDQHSNHEYGDCPEPLLDAMLVSTFYRLLGHHQEGEEEEDSDDEDDDRSSEKAVGGAGTALVLSSDAAEEEMVPVHASALVDCGVLPYLTELLPGAAGAAAAAAARASAGRREVEKGATDGWSVVKGGMGENALLLVGVVQDALETFAGAGKDEEEDNRTTLVVAGGTATSVVGQRIEQTLIALLEQAALVQAKADEWGELHYETAKAAEKGGGASAKVGRTNSGFSQSREEALEEAQQVGSPSLVSALSACPSNHPFAP